jgi:hypothetical protein
MATRRRADDDVRFEALTLEDRARLRAAHLRNVARHARAGLRMTLTPEQLEDTARSLEGLADVAEQGHPCPRPLP